MISHNVGSRPTTSDILLWSATFGGLVDSRQFDSSRSLATWSGFNSRRSRPRHTVRYSVGAHTATLNQVRTEWELSNGNDANQLFETVWQFPRIGELADRRIVRRFHTGRVMARTPADRARGRWWPLGRSIRILELRLLVGADAAALLFDHRDQIRVDVAEVHVGPEVPDEPSGHV